MINPQTRVFVIVVSLLVLLYVVNLVRTRRLREEFALLWLVAGFLLVGAALAVDWLDILSHFLGIEYPPAFMFLIAFLCLLFVCLQFSLHISKLSDQAKNLTQEVGILLQRIEQMEKRREREDA